MSKPATIALSERRDRSLQSVLGETREQEGKEEDQSTRAHLVVNVRVEDSFCERDGGGQSGVGLRDVDEELERSVCDRIGELSSRRRMLEDDSPSKAVSGGPSKLADHLSKSSSSNGPR